MSRIKSGFEGAKLNRDKTEDMNPVFSFIARSPALTEDREFFRGNLERAVETTNPAESCRA